MISLWWINPLWRPSPRSQRAAEDSGERQDHLADVAPLVNVPVRLRGLLDGERAIHARADAPFVCVAQQRLHLRADDRLLIPKMAQIDARDGAVVVHERKRTEARPAHYFPCRREQVSASARCQIGHAVAHEAPER